MNIFLKQNEDTLALPILPSSIEIGNTMQNTSVNITEFGEVNLIGNKGLRTLTLSAFFPKQSYSFIQNSDAPSPKECVELILSWMSNPIRVLITGIVSMSMTIESFQYSKQDRTGDIYYSLELKEYKNPKVKPKHHTVNKNSKKIQSVETVRESKKLKTVEYEVKKGDTLSVIAKKLTGSSANYMAIANQNNITNPNKIVVGQKLVIKV